MKSRPLLKASVSLRLIRFRLPRLGSKREPAIDLSTVRREIETLLDRVTAGSVEQAGLLLDHYVDSYVADWLGRANVHHRTVTAELDVLAVRVSEARELFQVHYDDQAGVLDDLEGAVSHALERVSDPDAPYYEPEPRNKRRGESR